MCDKQKSTWGPINDGHVHGDGHLKAGPDTVGVSETILSKSSVRQACNRLVPATCTVTSTLSDCQYLVRLTKCDQRVLHFSTLVLRFSTQVLQRTANPS